MEIGVFVKCPHPEMIEALALAGADFAVVDMEHTPLGPRDLYPLVLAAEARQFQLVVRVPENAPQWFRWCLDLGARQIQVPDVRTLDDSLRAIDACQFPPAGKRGLCRFVRAADFSSMTMDHYRHREQVSIRPVLQIEHHEAVHNLSSLLMRGLHSVLIGPYDLSASLGVPGDVWNPAVTDCSATIISECKARSIPVGVFTDSLDGITYWRSRGCDFVEYGSDLQLLMGAVRGLRK